MSIGRHPITPLETEIIEWARKNDTLSDHCDLIDYYTDTGVVPEHWRVKWPIMGVAKAFAQAKLEQAAQPLTHEHVRAVGGIVHGDGNIFFTNIEKLNAAVEAAKPA